VTWAYDGVRLSLGILANRAILSKNWLADGATGAQRAEIEMDGGFGVERHG